MAKKTLTFKEHAAKYKLDDEEQELLHEVENGEWFPSENATQQVESFKADMRSTMKALRGTRKAISIRLPEQDIAELKKLAERSGVKYQTLVCDVLHKYVACEKQTKYSIK